MEETLVAGQQARFSPPGRGLALGWRLALSTALIIGVVMGSVSVAQQFLDLQDQRATHQRLLKMSLIPLAVRLEAATQLDAMQREVREFHNAYTRKGYADHELVLFNTNHERVFSIGAAPPGEQADDRIKAEVPVFSSLLDGGRGSLLLTKNDNEFRDTVRRDWLLWAIHFAVTLGVIFLFLAAAIYYMVTEPIGRLLRVVRKMERGYWKPIDLAGGAWEIRWLAWRFGNMVQEVRIAMMHLLEAEQKAKAAVSDRADGDEETSVALPDHETKSTISNEDDPVRRRLLATCEALEGTSPADSRAVTLGRRAWEQEAAEANRHGFQQLKIRLENAALRLMHPDTHQQLDQYISELQEFWQERMQRRRETLNHLLEEHGIPCVEVLYRVKHTAGVWAKMQQKGLTPHDVQDLFAFRIIVPTEADCYAALGIIHEVYKPEIARFKDYIARPKSNGYRSLHTSVAAGDDPVFELQIRSLVMDRQAEQGEAAHWAYKADAYEADRRAIATHWWHRLFLRHENLRPS